MSEWYEVEPSPLRNVASGTSVGCGCLGVLIVLVGVVSLLGIYLEVYDGGPGSTLIWGSFAIAVGMACLVIGVVGWVASLFLD